MTPGLSGLPYFLFALAFAITFGTLQGCKTTSQAQKHPKKVSPSTTPQVLSATLPSLLSPLFLPRPLTQVYPTNNALPRAIRALMPLPRWNERLPVERSPAISSCRKRIVQIARKSIGRQVIRCTRHAGYARYKNDCSGWIRCVYSRIGVDVFASPTYRGSSGTFSLFHHFKHYGMLHRGLPRPGDVVFWHATVDRNRNGRLDDDPITHVGLVDKIEKNGRIRVLHTGFGQRPGVNPAYMYLPDPDLWRQRRQLLSHAPKSDPFEGNMTLYAPGSQNTCPLAARPEVAAVAACPASMTPRQRCAREKKLHKACMKYLRRYPRKSKKRRAQLWRCQWRKKRSRRFCKGLRKISPREAPAPTPQLRRRPSTHDKPVVYKRRRRRTHRQRRNRLYNVYNSYLVSPRSRKHPRYGHTTGELFAGYATLTRCPK